ncbi:B3 domain-containing protein os03g0212300 [Phtheirospermum japonicum]|uniref:B3 domain-containing protein os03g0212300 n=1 Tax=Phtheirospermum japonicum TaxID=374723 RepID=A0A830CJA8_9LAMI|nr:B3 domain-containing protein os03g0212300 [Phtheirospermum japonicum]
MAKQKLGKDDFGSPDKRPGFFKIIWFANTINLRIPPDFKHHLVSKEQTERAILKTPRGNWVVKIVQKEGDLYFAQKGWQQFLKHHSLGHAEFVVFKYNGDTSFDVVIYEQNGCARNYPSRFTSPFPFFSCVMKNHNIGTSSKVFIPRTFQQKHLPLSKQGIILQDSEGVSWPVTVTISGNKLMLIGGWKAFADSHSIEKGDDCIFELVEQNMMKVHIFRHNN